MRSTWVTSAYKSATSQARESWLSHLPYKRRVGECYLVSCQIMKVPGKCQQIHCSIIHYCLGEPTWSEANQAETAIHYTAPEICSSSWETSCWSPERWSEVPMRVGWWIVHLQIRRMHLAALMAKGVELVQRNLTVEQHDGLLISCGKADSTCEISQPSR